MSISDIDVDAARKPQVSAETLDPLALSIEEPIVALGLAVQEMLVQKLGASPEVAFDLAKEILCLTGNVPSDLEDDPARSIESDRDKIIREGIRLGEETRRRGISTQPSPDQVTALACVYLQEELKRLHIVVKNDSLGLKSGTAAIQQLAAVRAELAEKTAALRAVDREASAKHIETKIAEAREAERAAVTAEVTALRAICAQLRSENEELRANKKKLREALDRAKEKQ